MKRTPTLRFEYDEAVERGLRISAILDDPEEGQR
jgi:ribosome-binding factor A